MPGTVIIGAGFAGLSAAASLRARGDESFVVLEARDRPGGRTKAGKPGGLTVDLGEMWMAPSQTRLQELAASFGIGTYPTHLDGNAIFRIGGNVRHSFLASACRAVCRSFDLAPKKWTGSGRLALHVGR